MGIGNPTHWLSGIYLGANEDFLQENIYRVKGSK